MWSTLVLIGVGAILAAIVGGGVKLASVEIGQVASLRRQIALAVFGLALIGFGLVGGGMSENTPSDKVERDDLSSGGQKAGEARRLANQSGDRSGARSVPSRGEFDDCGGEAWCPKMVPLPGNMFLIGTSASEPGRENDEGPQRKVNLRPFAVSKFEITFSEWDACVADRGCDNYRPSDSGFGRGDRPVINVSWHRSIDYVNWLSNRTGRNYRLLSEAEWEYAARAGTASAWPWGDDPNGGCDDANIADLSLIRADPSYSGSRCDDGVGSQTAIVGSYASNRFGLYDMIGNVWEWTQDCYRNNYDELPADGSPATTGDCNNRVHRGGSWDAAPLKSRAGYRNWWDPASRNNNLGIRVARTL